jgi:16S rRNA (cytidine1402-2'-O)-methyltransferase
MQHGKIYLIPTTLGDTETDEVLPNSVHAIVNSIDHYLVEELRHARRFLKKLNIIKPIDELSFVEMKGKLNYGDITRMILLTREGKNIGVISEAGVPCIADPGAEIVNLAHQKNITIMPLVGPSSILMALMGSGMNGQNFAFTGYLPKERKDRIQRIRQLENIANAQKQTQLFMDTPYRNNHVLEDLLQTCSSSTQLCIAADITLPTQFIKSKSIKDWKSITLDLNKRPCIFIIGAL